MAKNIKFSSAGGSLRGANPKKGLDDALSALGASLPKGKVDPKLEKKFAKFKKNWLKLAGQFAVVKGDFRSDSSTRATYHAMMATMMELIPIAEQKYLETKSESAIYALQSIFNQIKDLSSLIRALDDLETQVVHIEQNIIHPAYINITQSMLAHMVGLKSRIDSLTVPVKEKKRLKSELDTALKEFAIFLQQSSKQTSANIGAYLMG